LPSPGRSAGVQPPDAAPLCAVIDIDGVVADLTHRLHYLESRPGTARRRPDWDAFFAAVGADDLLEEGAAAVHALAVDAPVIWLTGRPERCRAATLTWLAAQGLPAGELQMRPDRDRRPARVFKLGRVRTIARRCQIVAILDDDPAVVAALKADGWPVFLVEAKARTERFEGRRIRTGGPDFCRDPNSAEP
jgi:hypothetical protein